MATPKSRAPPLLLSTAVEIDQRKLHRERRRLCRQEPGPLADQRSKTLMNTGDKKRILVAMPGLHRIGGIETFCTNTMRGFARRGWDVHCLVTNYRGDGFGNVDGVTYHDLSGKKL